MSKYQTEAGIECTPEECKLIDGLKRLAKKWDIWMSLMDNRYRYEQSNIC
jgi:hypothetical protein